jgi:hypothetical protein
MLEAGEIEWTPGPPSIPEGAEAAVLYGDPTKAEPFALRLKLPADYVLPAHTHPKHEIVTVLSGTFQLGMGAEASRDGRPISRPAAFSLSRRAWRTTPIPTRRPSFS